MACLLMNQEDVHLTVPTYQTQDGVTFYILEVRIANVKWTVKHRYNEFVELHDVLVSEHCVDKDILPPKKLIGNKTESFVEKRRVGLENYLNNVYNYLKKIMPRVFALFLELHLYEIFFILQSLSYKFFTEGEKLLMGSSTFKFNPIQVYLLIYF